MLAVDWFSQLLLKGRSGFLLQVGHKISLLINIVNYSLSGISSAAKWIRGISQRLLIEHGKAPYAVLSKMRYLFAF